MPILHQTCRYLCEQDLGRIHHHGSLPLRCAHSIRRQLPFLVDGGPLDVGAARAVHPEIHILQGVDWSARFAPFAIRLTKVDTAVLRHTSQRIHACQYTQAARSAYTLRSGAYRTGRRNIASVQRSCMIPCSLHCLELTEKLAGLEGALVPLEPVQGLLSALSAVSCRHAGTQKSCDYRGSADS